MALLSANQHEILDSKRLTGYRRGSQCDESLETLADARTSQMQVEQPRASTGVHESKSDILLVVVMNTE